MGICSVCIATHTWQRNPRRVTHIGELNGMRVKLCQKHADNMLGGWHMTPIKAIPEQRRGEWTGKTIEEIEKENTQ